MSEERGLANTKVKHNIWSVKQAEVSSSNKFNEQEHDKLIAAITSSYTIT